MNNINTNDEYSFFKNQVGLSGDKEIVDELNRLKTYEDDFNFHLIEKEVKAKIEIILEEINKRGIEI